MALDPNLVVHLEHAGREACLRGCPRGGNPYERRAHTDTGPLDTEEEWRERCSAWWRGWDSAFEGMSSDADDAPAHSERRD